MRVSDSVSFSFIYEDTYIILEMSRSVNNSRTNCFVCDLFRCLGFLVLNGPPPPSPSPASMSKFPSGGNKYGNKCLFSDFLDSFMILNDLGEVFLVFYKFRRKKLLVSSAGNITGVVGGSFSGIFGGKYYWYCRREILLVLSAVNITGIFGRRYYSRVAFVG